MVTFLGGSIDRLWIACMSWKSIILTNMMNNPFPGVQIVGTAQGDLSRKKIRTWGGLGCQSLLSPYLSLSPSQVFFLPLFFSALWLRAAPNYLNARNRLMTNMFATHFYPFFFQFLVGFEEQNLSFSLEKKIKHCSYCNNIEISSWRRHTTLIYQLHINPW